LGRRSKSVNAEAADIAGHARQGIAIAAGPPLRRADFHSLVWLSRFSAHFAQ
jgi:hypothetical protein